MSVHRAYYEAAEDHVKNILKVMLEISRQRGNAFGANVALSHDTYGLFQRGETEAQGRTRGDAEVDVMESFNRASKIQLAVRKVTPAVEPAEADALEPSQADDVKVKQVEVDAKPSDSAVKPGPLLKRAKTAPSRTFLQRAATASNLDQVKQGSTDDGR